MKKIYLNPEMTIVKINVQHQILAGSIGKGSGNINPGDMGAPQMDWDDDDFEEE